MFNNMGMQALIIFQVENDGKIVRYVVLYVDMYGGPTWTGLDLALFLKEYQNMEFERLVPKFIGEKGHRVYPIDAGGEECVYTVTHDGKRRQLSVTFNNSEKMTIDEFAVFCGYEEKLKSPSDGEDNP